MPPSVDISRSLAPCCWPTTRPTLVLAPCFPSPRSPAHLSQLMPRHHACRTHCARARAQPPFFLLLSPPLRSARVSDSAIGATALTGPHHVRLITAPRPRHHLHCLHSVGQMGHLLYPIVSAPSPLHRCAHVVTNLAHASPTTSALYAISTCHALPTGSPGAMPLPLCKASPPCTPHAPYAHVASNITRACSIASTPLCPHCRAQQRLVRIMPQPLTRTHRHLTPCPSLLKL